MADRSLRADDQEEAVRRYADMVYRLAFARMGNTSDAEDVFQEVFLRYLTSARDFASEEHRKAWLLKVTVNCAKKLHTAPWRRRTEPLDETVAAPSREDTDLWEQLLALCGVHTLRCHWVKGHAENEFNNRCDQLAVAESQKYI